MIVVLTGLNSIAQNGFGAPVLLQDFGKGSSDPSAIGTPLPAYQSSYNFSTLVCPPPGSYTIMRRINFAGCFNDSWIPLSSDYNSDVDTSMYNGNMMIVNNDFHPQDKILFVDTITKGLCPGARYSFTAALINIVRPEKCTGNISFSNFVYNIETPTGQILATDTTRGGLVFASTFMGYRFTRYAISFVMPNGVNKLIARIIAQSNGAECGEDFALDDIRVSPIGPKAKIAFSNEPTTTIVKSVCFQQNKTIALEGTMDPFYTTPALQWQQSVDMGVTWTDIPGATSASYSRVFSTPDTFLFRLSGSEANNITNPNCRVVSNYLTVYVDGIPTNFIAKNNSPVCAGSELKFDAGGGASYQWWGPNGFQDNISFPHISYASLSDSGMYYVRVFTLGGCSAIDSTYARVIGTDVHAWPDTTICVGETIQLNASAGKSYQWQSSNVINNTTNQNITVTPNTSASYTVQVTDAYGCSDTASATINIKNKIAVKAKVEAPGFLCPINDSIAFLDKSSGQINSWIWDFGNGQSSRLQQPPIQYYTPTVGANTIIARLTVSDSLGCTSTTDHALNPVANCYIAVPAAFTPNRDGINDYLYPLNAYKAIDLKFKVYNRIGQLVFETTDWTKKWNGNVNGAEQVPGAYVWILEYKTPNGNFVSLKGTTLLIR
ncbi:MAG: gliding motility-associated C-terminal domain-containing protein [Ferruginibacter sp.]